MMLIEWMSRSERTPRRLGGSVVAVISSAAASMIADIPIELIAFESVSFGDMKAFMTPKMEKTCKPYCVVL